MERFADQGPIPRRFKIQRADLEGDDGVGFTDHCPQCDHIERYGESRGGITHSEACRARIMDELVKTPAGKVRVQNTKDRIDRALAESVEKQVEEKSQGRPDGARGVAHDGHHAALHRDPHPDPEHVEEQELFSEVFVDGSPQAASPTDTGAEGGRASL